MKFCIVSCVHNAKDFIQNHLDSVKGQKHVEFVHLVIDDASTDGTFDILQEEKKKRGEDFKLLRKKSRGGAVQSFRTAMDNLPPLEGKDVIVELDGDDYFLHDEALRTIEEAHSDGYLATYGNYQIEWDPAQWDQDLPSYFSKSLCGPKITSIPLRDQLISSLSSPKLQVEYRYTAVRTFRKFLWDLLPASVWVDKGGEIIPHCKDVLYFLPILEMVDWENVKHIEEPIMIYNYHPNSDFAVGGHGCGAEAKAETAIQVSEKLPIPKLSNISQLRDKFDIPVVFMED